MSTERRCQLCDELIPDTADVRTKFCGARCRTARKFSRIYLIECEWCSAPSVKRRLLGRFCTPRCRQHAQDSDKDRNRVKNQRRRLLGRTGSYKLADIAERDGYRCHLCNRKVDMSLPGTDRMGPTVDHLIPLRDNGDDVESNVALAHRSCNCSRQHRGNVQLRLAA
jgi:HNH endonuclease